MKTLQIILILIIPIYSFSQSPNKLKRRTYANQLYDITEKGHLQTETFLFLENNQNNIDNYFLPDIRLRYGLHEDLEIFADIDLIYNKEQKFGLIPLGFGFKVNVMEEKNYMPDIAFVTSLQFGNLATQNFRFNKIMPLIGVIANKKITEKFILEMDYFIQWIDDEAYQTNILDLNATYQITDKFGISTGINYYTDELNENNVLGDIGFSYQNKSTTYSLEYGHKLYTKNLSSFIGIGITKDFNFNNQK